MVIIRARLTPETQLRPLMQSDATALLGQVSVGQTVFLTIDHPRSLASHGHQFAWLADAWASLPESLMDAPYAASPDALRKHALIATHFCQVEVIDVGSKAGAARVAEALHRHASAAHGYAIKTVRGPVVTIYTPESQSMRAMGSERFNASKRAVLEWVAKLLETTPEALERAESA